MFCCGYILHYRKLCYLLISTPYLLFLFNFSVLIMFSKAKEIDDGPAELESQFVLRLPVVSL